MQQIAQAKAAKHSFSRFHLGCCLSCGTDGPFKVKDGQLTLNWTLDHQHHQPLDYCSITQSITHKQILNLRNYSIHLQ